MKIIKKSGAAITADIDQQEMELLSFFTTLHDAEALGTVLVPLLQLTQMEPEAGKAVELPLSSAKALAAFAVLGVNRITMMYNERNGDETLMMLDPE